MKRKIFLSDNHSSHKGNVAPNTNSKRRKLEPLPKHSTRRSIQPQIWAENVLPFLTKYQFYKNPIVLLSKQIREVTIKLAVNVNSMPLRELHLLRHVIENYPQSPPALNILRFHTSPVSPLDDGDLSEEDSSNLTLLSITQKRLELYEHLSRYPDLSLCKITALQDKELLQHAVRGYGCSLRYADKPLRTDKETVLIAVAQDGLALQYASPTLKGDKEVVKVACSNNGMALEFADLSIRSDKECCLISVQQNGLSLQHVHPILRADREVALAALKQDHSAYQFLDPSLRRDRELTLISVKKFPQALLLAHETVRDDREVVRHTVINTGMALQFAPFHFLNDTDIVMEAVKEDGLSLQWASEDLRNDRDIVLTALQRDGFALEFVGDKLSCDPEVIRTALRQNASAVSCVNISNADPKTRELLIQSFGYEIRSTWSTEEKNSAK